MQPAAKWTNDFQGKKDYDGDILTISTRYWPSGGGFHVLTERGEWQGNEARPEIKPAANASILLHYHDPKTDSDDYITLIEQAFEGETFEEVKAKVEQWVEKEYRRAADMLHSFYEK